MPQIATYVFLDIETTGKESTRKNMDKIKITEISLVAVKRKHLLETAKGSTPRVLNKMTLCLNPSKEIQQSCVKVSGLTNELLEKESPINENVIKIINTFLNMLTNPVCLVAHNGFHWDFPIMKSNLGKTALSHNILSTDSFFAFYDILNARNTVHDSQTISSCGTLLEFDLYQLETYDNAKIHNERTPQKPTVSMNEMPEKLSMEESYYFQVKNTYPWGQYCNKPEESYKLKNIYSTLFDEEPSLLLHRAENDTIVLLECAIAIKEEFVDWVDNHHDYFSVISSMCDSTR